MQIRKFAQTTLPTQAAVVLGLMLVATAYVRALAAASDPHEVRPPLQSGNHADNNELTETLLSMRALTCNSNHGAM